MKTKKPSRDSRRAEPPCSASCDKCGGTDIYRRHHRKGDKWDKMLGDYRRWETAHVSYDTNSCVARHECLTHHCRTCGYEWTTECARNRDNWKKRAEAAEAKLDWLLAQGIRGIAPGWVGIPEVEWDSTYPTNSSGQTPPASGGSLDGVVGRSTGLEKGNANG